MAIGDRAGQLAVQARPEGWMVTRDGRDFAGPFGSLSAALAWMHSFRKYPS